MAKEQQITTNFSPAGNRTPVSRVTGGDTYHYTTEETDGCLNSFLNFSLKLSHFLLLRMAKNSNKLRRISPRRGIEPRSPAWQAGILTTILPRKTDGLSELFFKFFTEIKSFSVVKNGQKQQQTTYFSTAGNRTPVSRVTGGDTYHYTTEENRWLSELFFLNFFTQIKSFSVVKNGQKQQQTTYFSTAGIWTPVSHVTGGDTHHYTTEETDGCLNSCLNFLLELSHFLLLRMAKNSNEPRISPRRGFEPRSPAWQAGILTTILPRKQMVVWTLV